MLTNEELDEKLGAPRPAPTVTPDRLEAIIAGEQCLQPTDTLTLCILTLANGFTVTGESACAAPENFDQAIGEKLARDNAKRKIWPLEGYLLKQRLADERDEHATDGVSALDAELGPVGRKLVQLYADNLEAAQERVRLVMAGGDVADLQAVLSFITPDGSQPATYEASTEAKREDDPFLDRSIDAIAADLPGLSVDELRRHLADERTGKTRVRLVSLLERRIEDLGGGSPVSTGNA